MTTSSINNKVTIRSAVVDDFDWVADLMSKSLSMFYGGDHYAHAKRIFDTHILGGIDRVGHFSASQHMFIAELGGERAGLVHIVVKRQGTLKISPLIVSPTYRGRFGIGSALLGHAEDFARSINARQIYCTVASSNQGVLHFLLAKGFCIAGTAKDHYKLGVDEHMLYKDLGRNFSISLSNVSVVLFDYDRHSDGVRRLILAQMSGVFCGVDNEWVDTLFAGFKRRISTDVNVKYKIIFVAEHHGEVIGVAGATPKKGEPIKIMPLVASNEEAFEVLVIGIERLLKGYGHKMYAHLVADSCQIAVLQRHGWLIEGVFPGGYSPGRVVQQWGRKI